MQVANDLKNDNKLYYEKFQLNDQELSNIKDMFYTFKRSTKKSLEENQTKP